MSSIGKALGLSGACQVTPVSSMMEEKKGCILHNIYNSLFIYVRYSHQIGTVISVFPNFNITEG